MKKITTALILFAALLFTASVHAVLIDFEGLSAGDVVTGSTIDGATFTVTDQGTTSGNPRELMIFQSNCFEIGMPQCTGGDSDLSTIDVPGTVTPITAGNVLIISQDNDDTDPNDSAAGGVIITTFDTDVTAVEIVTIDVGDSDTGPNTFEAYYQGMLQDSVNLMLNLGENNIQTASLTGLFDEIRLDLAGSGALASIEFTPVPIPAALPLFMAGLVGLFGLRKKA